LTTVSPDEFPLIIAATPASKQERRVALAIILILALVFIILAQFESVKLPRVDAFVPALQTVLCVTDLITAALLFSLYSIQPLPLWPQAATSCGLSHFYKRLLPGCVCSFRSDRGSTKQCTLFVFSLAYRLPWPSPCMRCRMIAREPMIPLADRPKRQSPYCCIRSLKVD
jgi:hypothetical protein